MLGTKEEEGTDISQNKQENPAGTPWRVPNQWVFYCETKFAFFPSSHLRCPEKIEVMVKSSFSGWIIVGK